MKDKEVGELWRKLNSDCGKGIECDNHGEIYKLICKLVEERARYHVSKYEPEPTTRALRDFGIDEKD